MESIDATAAVPAETPPDTSPQAHRFEFHGSGGEYFRIWIVNLLLTLVTLGIYGAWAKVRRLRYFYGSTELAGSAFEYHGEPRKILKGRLIAAGLLAIYSLANQFNPIVGGALGILFVFLVPILVVKSRRFLLRMSSWRNIRFDFAGSYESALRTYIGIPLLATLTLGVLYPYSIFRKQGFIIGESRFGVSRFGFGAKVKPYYMAYAIGSLYFILCAAVAAALYAATRSLDIIHISDKGETFSYIGTSTAPLFVVAVLLALAWTGCVVAALAALILPAAVIKARTNNEAFGAATVEGHRLQCALAPYSLARIYFINTVLIVLTLGLYTPWAKIRLLRYQLQNMSLVTAGSLDAFTAVEQEKIGATGEEVSDLFDVDFGL